MIKKWNQFNENLNPIDMNRIDLSILEKGVFEELAAAPRKISNEHPKWLLYLSTEILDNIKRKYNDALDKIFSDLHNEYTSLNITKTPDIVDYHTNGWNIIETTANQIIHNMDMPSIAKSLKSDKVNFQILSELKDETNILIEGDEVILVTSEHSSSSFSKINNFLIKVINGTHRKLGDHDIVVTTDGVRFLIKNSIHVVKKETYEDFAGSL
jgi:hypothetical protein